MHIYKFIYDFINMKKDVKGFTPTCQHRLPGRMSGRGLAKQRSQSKNSRTSVAQ